ncbi:MAG TPA: radical SAM family heme chaperone HemW [Polyangiales bacterium]
MTSLSVYVHFPWCLRKCPYCDFATSPLARDDIPHQAYADAVLRELEARAPALAGARLRSVFFGGGTPSLWQPEQLGRVLAGIRAAFGDRHDPDVEITAECNPSSLDARQAERLCAAGINRISVGVQSLDDDELRFLGRLHDRALALTALRAALAACPRVSADLMFALPGQPEPRFLGYVDALLDLGLRHVSAYALTIEPSTPFGAQARKGLLQQAPDELYANLFSGIEARFAAAGLAHYEVSNYAAPGEESRHNLHYWRGESYLGLGAAAVGCLSRDGSGRRYRNQPDAARYMERAALPSVEVFEEELDAQALIREALMLGLRVADGVDLAALEARLGVDPRRGRERALERRLARGDVLLEGIRLRVPHQRWLLLDGIVADLF